MREEGAWPALGDRYTSESIQVGLNVRASEMVHRQVTSSQYLPKEKLKEYVLEKIKGYITIDKNLPDLVKITNEELDCLIKKYRDRLEAIDRNADG